MFSVARDAWNSLGNMTKEEAMMAYVEDIQLVSLFYDLRLQNYQFSDIFISLYIPKSIFFYLRFIQITLKTTLHEITDMLHL